ncbi:H-type small acid-soluble spore protein [Ferviditalea candida]|uniref:H-type small acid-soluble spore protein n=1 Tax=Ferviditalea candida TaxID=3108399 RepID=A0ABU5ZEH6_9BACL|nr:H-type small acid-soluble spore protein [Paenibacillaceae bacterium T2]
MDIQRAKQILEMSDFVDVQFDGQAVWIDSVDMDSGAVKVHSMDNEADRKSVSPEQLRELS